MLVLSRNVGESIIIGKTRVLVVGIDRKRVRLGIDAPKDIAVDREEIWRSKHGKANKITNR